MRRYALEKPAAMRHCAEDIMQPSPPNGLPGPLPGRANCLAPGRAPGHAGPAGQPAPDAGRGVPARRGGHDFYSMTDEMPGKCAFPSTRRTPRRLKILVPF